MHTIRQWISRAIALAVIGPIASEFAVRAVATDGSGHHTLLSGLSAGTGALTLLVVCLLLALMGLLGHALGGRREAMLGMGFVLGWVAWTTGRLGQVYRLAPEPGTLVLLAIETLVLLLAVLVVVALISRNDEDDPISSFQPQRLLPLIREPAMLGALGGALAVAAVVAWLFGRTDLPGQSTGVGFLAGIGAGVAGAMVAGSMRAKDEHTGTPFAPLMVGVMLCGVLAPIVGIVAPGAGALSELAMRGDLPGYLIVSPVAWVAGALLGVPVGHSWVEHSHARADEHAKASG